MTNNGKPILDACCGSRMFWFDKDNPFVEFMDIRDEEVYLSDGFDWEAISPPMGKGMEGFNAAKEWLENHKKGVTP